MPSSIKIKFPRLNYNREKLKEYKKKNLSIKDKQIAKLSKKIIFCKKCVTSSQRPRIKFDKDGVCGPCRYAEKKFGEFYEPITLRPTSELGLNYKLPTIDDD